MPRKDLERDKRIGGFATHQPGKINENLTVINRLDPIQELYDMYLEEEGTPRIVGIEDNGLDFVSDVEGLADVMNRPSRYLTSCNG